MSQQIEQILVSEGLEIFRPKSSLEISENCRRAAIDLFRFLPELHDPRWTIAQSWALARQRGIKPIHEEASQSAVYLSDLPSYRNGYSSFQSEENLRLIVRAATNLNSLNLIKQRYGDISSGGRLTLALTNKITRGVNPDGTTGCPEALYQIQLRNSGHYLGRVGFNIHRESSSTIVSISNIQGVPDGQIDHARYEDNFGENPFIYLVTFVKNMFPDLIIRGIKNPPKNPGFYNTVLKRAGVTRIDYLSR